MSKVVSPEELWRDFSVDDGNVEESVGREFENDGKIYREVYFNGKRTANGVTRIFCVFARPKDRTDCPVILLCHDTDSSVDYSFIDYFVEQNFAVLMCDAYGLHEGRKYTFYPDDVSFANKENNAECFEINGDPKDNLVYEWTCVHEYAIKYLKTLSDLADTAKIAVIGIRDGAIFSWQLAFLDDNITCAVSLFYAGWREYGKKYKNSHEKPEDLSPERTAYIAAMSPQVYAPLIKKPMLYLTASNDELGNLDRAFDTMARINGAVASATFITPNAINNLDSHATRNLRLWLNMYLNGAKLTLPDKPMLTLEVMSNTLLAKCMVDDIDNVKNVKLYYSEGSTVPSSRCYMERALALSGGGYVGAVDISSSNEIFYCFANVEFMNGYSVTSNFIAESLEGTGLNKNLTKENLIYNGFMGVDAFTGIPELTDTNAEGTFADKPSIEIVEGAGGIEGLKSSLNLATFKLAHPRFSGEDGDILMLDVCSDAPQSIIVRAYCSLGEDDAAVFSAEIKTVGGPLWQNYKLEVMDFKDEKKAAMDSWSEISLMVFSSDGEFIINNILWI